MIRNGDESMTHSQLACLEVETFLVFVASMAVLITLDDNFLSSPRKIENKGTGMFIQSQSKADHGTVAISRKTCIRPFMPHFKDYTFMINNGLF